MSEVAAAAAPTSGVLARSPATVLHIGTMKSGTSYLQDTLDRNREALAAAGVNYLGRGTRAVRDVLRLRPPSEKTDGAWQQLVQRANQSDSPIRLLSMEMLSTASEADAREVVRAFAPDPVEIVITARDMARVIPSAWQNAVKHGSMVSFPTFVDTVMGKPANDNVAERFWTQHDLLTITRRWVDLVGASRVHLVTVPPSGAPPTLLWERFCEVLGLDHAAYDTQQDRNSNFSLTYSDAELLRRVNRRIGPQLGRHNYERYVRAFLANEVMRPAEPGAGPADIATLSPEAHAWAVQRAQQLRSALADSGVDVVGDLEELVPAPVDGASGAPPQVVYPDTAVRAIAMLLRKLVEIDPKAEPMEPPAAPEPAQRRRKGLRAKAQRGRA